MLKRLKIKFVLIIMTVVTLMFAAMFGLVMHLTKENIERESIQMMRSLAFRPPDGMTLRKPDDKPNNKPNDRPGNKPEDMPDNFPEGMPDARPDNMPEDIPNKFRDGIRLPYFTVSIAPDGALTVSGSDFYDLSDEELLRELVDTAEQSKDQIGMILKYDLRFMKSDSPREKSIIFADISSEKAMLRGLIRNFVLIGLIGYAVFFFISLLLAKWLTRPVETTWNEQKQFIADASHELKTPLTVIMTNAEMMSDQSYAERDRAQFTQNILATSKRMRGLVESLLELARLDNAKKAEVQHTEVDLSKLLNDCILPFEPLFFENDLMLQSDIAEHITVKGNADKLRQVITILLDNALKYSDPAGTVNVTLKQQGAACVLSVSDKGAPLSKEDCKRIFKRFYRVDEARNDGQSYGLGLSIAESIVQEHGGKIWAESENGYNTFHVSLIQ